MKTLIQHAKELGATSLNKVVGPRGAFISLSFTDGSKTTLPVGKRSQNGKLSEYNILITDGSNGLPAGQVIATVNEYSEVEAMVL